MSTLRQRAEYKRKQDDRQSAASSVMKFGALAGGVYASANGQSPLLGAAIGCGVGLAASCCCLGGNDDDDDEKPIKYKTAGTKSRRNSKNKKNKKNSKNKCKSYKK